MKAVTGFPDSHAVCGFLQFDDAAEISRHFGQQRNENLAYSADSSGYPYLQRRSDKFPRFKKATVSSWPAWPTTIVSATLRNANAAGSPAS